MVIGNTVMRGMDYVRTLLSVPSGIVLQVPIGGRVFLIQLAFSRRSTIVAMIDGIVTESSRGQTEEVTVSSSNIVWLTGVGERAVPGKADTFCKGGLEHRQRSGIGIVGVLQPDLNEVVEHTTRHHTRERFLAAEEISTAYLGYQVGSSSSEVLFQCPRF